jgi:glycosyltransferase involved in cell wall biosynthesis
MKVLYDGQIFRQQRYGGISRYFSELVPRVHAAAGVQALVVAPRHRNAYLQALPATLQCGWYKDRIGRPRGLQKLAMRATERFVAWRFAPDIVHETYFFGPVITAPRALRVLTIYDMIHERFPERFAADNPDARAKRASALRADHVLCISECTRRDVIELLGLPEHKVTVTYLSTSLQPPAVPAPLPDIGGRPFVLYVGDRGGYKNFEGLLRALRGSIVLNDAQLVCYGGGQFTADDWAAVQSQQLPRECISWCNGGDDTLVTLYAHALCLVVPSLYEGFGLPPLEAMQCGCPVVCSTGGSLPEVTGDACASFDPNDSDALRTALESVVLSESRRQTLRALGLQQAQRFSWQRCADETVAVYRQLVAGAAA